MQATIVGLALAENAFHVHGITDDGQIAFNEPLRRSMVLGFFARRLPWGFGVEGRASGHYWARELSELGHTVRLMPPMYVIRK